MKNIRKRLLFIFLLTNYIVLFGLIILYVLNKSEIFYITPSVNLTISILVYELLLTIKKNGKNGKKEKVYQRLEMRIAYASAIFFFFMEVWTIYLFVIKEISAFYFFALAMSIAMSIGLIVYQIGKILRSNNLI